jgi:mono/diheme cytochrome c family protein
MQFAVHHLALGATLLISAGITLVSSGCGSDSSGGDTASTTGGTAATGGTGAGTAGTAGTSTSTTCTSGVSWTPQQGESVLMRPGESCIACHSLNSEAPTFAIAGTVYPALHDANDCNGSASTSATAITVVITDADGTDHVLPVNSAGNFMLETSSIPTPYQARVEVGTLQSAMGGGQTTGDCNACHTATGANGAPGRILSP